MKGKPGRFVCGPIPLDWITHASRLGGSCLAVGVVLWYRVALTKSRTVSVGAEDRTSWGLQRHAVQRALRKLRDAELVGLTIAPGRLIKVTVLAEEGWFRL